MVPLFLGNIGTGEIIIIALIFLVVLFFLPLWLKWWKDFLNNK